MDQPWISNFEFHRTEIWRLNRRWIFGCVASIALLAVLGGVVNLPLQLAWLAMATTAGLIGVTAFRVVRALHVLYRCPSCGVLPYQTLNEYKCGGLGPSRSNFMSPRACPHCGTRIR